MEDKNKSKGWIARDDTYYLHVFSEKPSRNIDNGSLNFGDVWNGKRILTLDCNLLPQITWENEPIEVEIIIHIKNEKP
jgi:hypothetical protein